MQRRMILSGPEAAAGTLGPAGSLQGLSYSMITCSEQWGVTAPGAAFGLRPPPWPAAPPPARLARLNYFPPKASSGMSTMALLASKMAFIFPNVTGSIVCV